MDRKEIQRQIDELSQNHFAKLSDRKLKAIEEARMRHSSEIDKRICANKRIRAPGKRKTKLTMLDAEQIRVQYSQLKGKKKLAEEYGVSATTIMKIVRNLIFKS